jgi:hypothetical protein
MGTRSTKPLHLKGQGVRADRMGTRSTKTPPPESPSAPGALLYYAARAAGGPEYATIVRPPSPLFVDKAASV